MTFYLEDEHCQQILLGICHDGGYATLVESLLADELKTSGRITLLYGAQLAKGIGSLHASHEVHTVKFPSVFSSVWGDITWEKAQKVWPTMPKSHESCYQQTLSERNSKQDATARAIKEGQVTAEDREGTDGTFPNAFATVTRA